MKGPLSSALLFAATLSACGDPSSPSRATAFDGESRFAKPVGNTPTTTWKFPLAGAGLSVRGDGKYSDGTYSVYADGVCGVIGAFFDGSATSSGDMTLNTGRDRKCASSPRQLTLTYDDGFVETTGVFINLHDIQNAVIRIPIGTTAPRFLAIHYTTRCDALQFGKDANSDNVLVTRIDAHTWRAVSQAAPNDRAYCTTTARSYHMQVDFVVTSSQDLP
jgi:hypothetical protein